MPTYARKHQLTDSLLYHVYNRSTDKEVIFKNERDCYYFMDLLKRYSLRFDLKLYHWVIMANHYHLLLELNDPERISRIMAGLSKAYSCYHHKIYSAVGFLWQGRFKLQPVQKESYLSICGRYIERNPVKAEIVVAAHEYLFSSAGFYCSGKKDGITTENPYYEDFGANLEIRRSEYAEFLRIPNDEEETFFEDSEQPVGSKEFIKRLIKKNGRFIPRRRGRPNCKKV